MVDLCYWRARIGLFNSSFGHCSSFNGNTGSTSPWQCYLRVGLAFLCQLSSLLMHVLPSTNFTTPITTVFIADIEAEGEQTLIIYVNTKSPSLLMEIAKCCILSLCVATSVISGFLLLRLLLLMSGDIETNPGPTTAKPVGNLPLTIFQRYFARMANAFRETPELLANDLYSKNLIAQDTWDKVQLQLPPLEKANNLLMAVGPKIASDESDKTLRKLCRIMSKHENLKKLASHILKSYEAVLSGDEELRSSSDSESSEDDSDQLGKAVPLPTLVKNYVKYIKACYRETIFPNYLKFPTLLLSTASQYIKLALVKNEIKCVKQEQVEKMIELKREGRIEELCKSQGEISIKDLGQLPDGSIPTRILVQGAPGIGKTTFAWELCRQWEAGMLLQQFSIVIMLQLRIKSIIQAKNLEELITHHSPEVRKAICSYLDEENGKGLLLILEGFDEVLQTKLSEEHVIHQLLIKKVLPSATILVTTRPVATKDLPSNFLKHLNQHLEILGFTKKEIDEYIQSSCKNEPDLLKDFSSYLSTHPFAASVMCIPLQCAIITELYSNKWHTGNKDFAPQTLTELYTDLVKTLVLRYLSEHEVYSQQEQNIQTFTDLPKNVYKQLMELAKLAAEGIEQHSYIFQNLPCDPMGLMHREQGLQLKYIVVESYSFLHLTFQEYLAALYWSQRSSQELVELMKKPDLFPIKMLIEEGICNDQKSIIYHWPALMFIAGLTQLKGIPSEVFTSLFRFVSGKYNQKHEFSSSLCHLFFEVQHSEQVTITFHNGKFAPWLNTSFDAFTLAYTISHSSSTALWVIKCRKFEHLQMLLEGLKCSPPTEQSGRIDKIQITSKDLAPYVNIFPQLSQHTHNVKCVELKGDLAITQGKECTENLQLFHTYYPRLERMIIKSDSECLWRPVLSTLKTMNGLRELTLVISVADKYTPIPEQHIPTLTKLDLYHQLNYFTPLITPNAHNLEKLHLNECQLTGYELATLLHSVKLQVLKIKDSTIDNFEQFAMDIANSKSLKRVELINNDLQLAGAHEMTIILINSKTIEKLFVYDTTMGLEGAKLLVQEMRNSSVQRLSIPPEYYNWFCTNQSDLILSGRLGKLNLIP